tara:strand:+ start:227 stop:1153 length:927 start_codon:yes stop_codon:yes gene_type:complete
MAVVGNNTAGRALPNIGFFGTTYWTPAYDMQAYVYVIGGGGSGACSRAANLRSSGGGAGGCAVSLITILSSITYTVTVGAGGIYEYLSANGNNGSLSSLIGSNITTMIGNGGTGGVHASSGSVAGGAGGSATGGNICNNTGGAGGSCTDFNNATSGGGAVGLWSTGNAGAPQSVHHELDACYGGNTSYDPGTTTQGANHIYASKDGATTPLSGIVPFPVITETRHNSDVLSYPIQAGQTQHDRYRTNYIMPPAAPFCGGHGIGINLAVTAAGGHGSVGGGGGAAFATSSAWSGPGGNGAVLVFPVDMG